MVEPPDFIIRPCFEQDLDQVTAIYAHHVAAGAGTFELTPPSRAEMEARWSKIVAHAWPYLVAASRRDVSRVLGYAYAAQFRDRAAYAATFEDSVYVAPGAQRRGVGRALLKDVLFMLKADGAREVIAMIGDSQNQASIALHAAHGFRHIGVMTGVGEKFGRWLDVVVMQHSFHTSQELGD